MNATVKRIIELLFEDIELTDEVQAIRDEVMNNCQERFDDLVAGGLSEDEAIGAVVESLKGMEEVLKDYPRKSAQAETDDADGDDDDAELVFPAAGVRRIRAALVGCDMNVESSMDDQVHVYYDKKEMPFVSVKCSDGTLAIEEYERGGKRKSGHLFNFGMKMEDIKINSFEDIGRLIGSIRVNLDFNGDGKVTIALPDSVKLEDMTISTVSGDVYVEDAAPVRLNVSTTSGDVTVDADRDVLVQEVQVKTVSGDAELDMAAANLTVQTMSGDVELRGRADAARVNTVSGDLTLRAAMRTVEFKTISGDVEIDGEHEDLRSISGQTTSGDVTIRLPDHVAAKVHASSTSGDVSNHAREWATHTAAITVKSVSGDINIR